MMTVVGLTSGMSEPFLKMSAQRFVLVLFLVVLSHRTVSEVNEAYVEWDYITCVEDTGMREFLRQNYIPYVEEVVEYACIEKLLYPRAVAPTLSPVQTNWLNQLMVVTQREIDQANTPGILPVRVRKEYRTLTTSERTAFHDAVNQLKSDTGKYDALASLHVGATAASAHRGPAFFTWHRLFLLLFENALRQYDSSVVLPYWDTTLDAALEDPKTSILWTPSFMGNGNGIVDTGPFAGWTTQGRPLIRNIEESGLLMDSADIERVLAQSRLGQISFPNAELMNNIELDSYGSQLWVGGDMGRLSTAANDPLYFLLHAYIDCVWEKFRENQTEPQTDWPWQYEGNPAHAVSAFLQVMPNVRSSDVLTGSYENIYRCEEVPPCFSFADCPSFNLGCNLDINMCVPVTAGDPLIQEEPCHGSVGYQNTYCVDGNCNIANWVYLPVEIVYYRPPDYGAYNSRPLFSPRWVFNRDIYSPLRFNRTDSYRVVTSRIPFNPIYRECRCKNSDFGRVYLQSYGLNYQGSYREYFPVDRRLPLSSGIGYVAIKSPRTGTSRVMIRAYDDCGRICTPVCPPIYGNCSGIMEVDQSNPRGYATDLENAIYLTWDFTYDIPKTRDDFNLKFYCTFESEFPFNTMGFMPDPNQERPNRTDPGERPVTTTTPRTTPTTTTTTTTPTTTVLTEPNFCFNSSECYLGYEPTGCVRCKMADFNPCPDDEKTRYRQCGLGDVWYIKLCPAGLVWDQEITTCNYEYWIQLRQFFNNFQFPFG